MEKLQQPIPLLIDEPPSVCTKDYVNALIINEAGHALVFEESIQNNSKVHWHMLDQYLNREVDPFLTIQQALLQKTGYETAVWSYLGSHMMATDRPAGIGYFFCAQQARRTAARQLAAPEAITVKWVSLKDLRYALIDGRIATMSHALTVSLAMLTLLK